MTGLIYVRGGKTEEHRLKPITTGGLADLLGGTTYRAPTGWI
jgi:hypothetical protein